jgi:hypothetical protein
MKRAAIALLVLAASSAQAALTVESYHQMKKQHGADNEAIELQVRLYLDGLLDGLLMASRNVPEDRRTWCLPDDQEITGQLALELFENELQQRADEYAEFAELGIQIPFSLVMVDALQRAFPCPIK